MFFSSSRFCSSSGRWTSSFDKQKERMVVWTDSPHRLFTTLRKNTSANAVAFVRFVPLPVQLLVIEFYDSAWLSRNFWWYSPSFSNAKRELERKLTRTHSIMRVALLRPVEKNVQRDSSFRDNCREFTLYALREEYYSKRKRSAVLMRTSPRDNLCKAPRRFSWFSVQYIFVVEVIFRKIKWRWNFLKNV